MLARDPVKRVTASNTDDERTTPQISSPKTDTPTAIPGTTIKPTTANTSPLLQTNTEHSIASTFSILPDAQKLFKYRSVSYGEYDRITKETCSLQHKPGIPRHHPSQSLDLGIEVALPPSPILRPIGRQRTFSSDVSTLIAPSRSISWAPDQSNEPAEPLSWKMKLWNRIPHGMLVKAALEVFGLVLAVVSTFTYTYRSYQISLWQAEYSFYDHCLQVWNIS